MQTRKLKGLLEDIFGWDFEESALDVMCEDGDEVIHFSMAFAIHYLIYFFLAEKLKLCFLTCLQYAPVVVPPDEAMPVEDQAN